MPKTSKKLKLLDIDPLELARQLTLMEAALYKKIRPMECLQRSREAKPGKTADNITTIIQLSNRVGDLDSGVWYNLRNKYLLTRSV